MTQSDYRCVFNAGDHMDDDEETCMAIGINSQFNLSWSV